MFHEPMPTPQHGPKNPRYDSWDTRITLKKLDDLIRVVLEMRDHMEKQNEKANPQPAKNRKSKVGNATSETDANV